MCIIHVFIILRNYPNKIFLYPVIIRDTNFRSDWFRSRPPQQYIAIYWIILQYILGQYIFEGVCLGVI